ncbi:MAG: laminin G domain-containing protein [Phycisphaerales bacterium]
MSGGQSAVVLAVVRTHAQFLVSDGSNEPNLVSNVTVNDGEWHHVAAVRDADAGTLSLYVDYNFAGSIADTTTGDFGNANDRQSALSTAAQA